MDEVTPVPDRPQFYVVPVPEGEDMASVDNPQALLDAAIAASDFEPPVIPDDDPRPLIRANNEEIAVDWLRQTIGTGSLRNYFLRGGQLVHCVTLGEEGHTVPKNGHLDFDQVSISTVGTVLATLSDSYRFRRWDARKKSEVTLLFPRQPASDVVLAPARLPHVRTLRGVVNTPIVRADGSILTEAGYDDQTGLLYLPNEINIDYIADRPTTQDVGHALSWLALLVADFPFDSPDDLATYIGALMIPLLRDIAPPPYKMLAINAHAAGSGKSFLAEALRVIHHGKDGGVVRSGVPHAPDELRKWITSVLDTGGGGVVQIDNVRGGLGGDVLEGLLTSYRYNDRRLGASENVHSVNDRLWVVTGNNITLKGDMARRTLWSNINPGVENPERRTGPAGGKVWRIQEQTGLPFPAFVQKYRSELLHALLVLLRSWTVSGRPVDSSVPTSDSFGYVTQVVRGILGHCGISGQFDPPQAKQMSEDDQELAQLLHSVVAWRGSEWWSAAEMLKACDSGPFGQGQSSFDVSVVPMQKNGRLPSSISLGKWLGHRRQRGIDGLQLLEYVDRTKKSYWSVQAIATGS